MSFSSVMFNAGGLHLFQHCVVRENIHTHKVNGNSKGSGLFQKPNFLNESMKECPDGWGFNLKNLPWEGCGYFLEQHIRQNCQELGSNNLLRNTSWKKLLSYNSYTGESLQSLREE